jgi:integrase
MRHTYASNLLKTGRGFDEVMRLSGHSSVQITVIHKAIPASKEKTGDSNQCDGGRPEGKQTA